MTDITKLIALTVGAFLGWAIAFAALVWGFFTVDSDVPRQILGGCGALWLGVLWLLVRTKP